MVFEDLKCERKYVTTKQGAVEVDWNSNQHKLLHIHDLTHTEVCVTADGKKHFARAGSRTTINKKSEAWKNAPASVKGE